MTDISTAHRPVESGSGEAAMARLADRLASLAPPPMDLSPNSIMRPSPAVTAALATSAKIAARAHKRARRSRSIIGLTIDSIGQFVPYALVALGLRLIMARVFFLDGQAKVEGMRLPLSVQDFTFSLVVPMQVKAETFGAFMGKYAAVPVPPMLAAYLVSYAEFILPIMLVLGLATRFAAIGLLIMTALIQIYVLPEALWSVHVYWAAMLLVLISRGPGQISIDHIIRLIARR